MTRRRGGRPRVWFRLGCLGCSVPLLVAAMLLFAVALALAASA